MTTQVSITAHSPEAPLKQQALIALGMSPIQVVKDESRPVASTKSKRLAGAGIHCR